MSNPNQVLLDKFDEFYGKNNGMLTATLNDLAAWYAERHKHEADIRQSLLAEIAERLPKDRAVLKTTSESAQDYSLGFNAANAHARELLTELAEEGDKSKQEANDVI